MNLSNLTIGDIIIFNLDEIHGNNKNLIVVVGSKPEFTPGTVKFYPVLKKNHVDEFFISEKSFLISVDADNNSDKVFDIHSSEIPAELLAEEYEKYREIANKKFRYIKEMVGPIVLEDNMDEDVAMEDVGAADVDNRPLNPEIHDEIFNEVAKPVVKHGFYVYIEDGLDFRDQDVKDLIENSFVFVDVKELF